MPIYEFRCCKCQDIFELLILNEEDNVEMNCPRCKSENFERVVSVTNYCMRGTSDRASGPKTQTRRCSGGTCTTYEIPGPTG
ncbi:MAG: zinc ribbon domain-containing protein [Deltaproteobacteria bacterium]|nr:zinc ribbon domain-containing protein [Deltaproteobacteria bacterium]MBW1962254.1 zinc ribbon domain-containing protein [Deltaproteobacteria bacterium]MBW1992951.1 zinc ribbon domain-containing protein [Deltaproteobacteria bacterium]MBW2150982.1 zinc ribbon domain-containing protein [Deltaproteobacteria bacterium]